MLHKTFFGHLTNDTYAVFQGKDFKAHLYPDFKLLVFSKDGTRRDYYPSKMVVEKEKDRELYLAYPCGITIKVFVDEAIWKKALEVMQRKK